MSYEFETIAEIDGEKKSVTVSYELDGYKPLGLWAEDEYGNDVTLVISEAEYDRLYEIACGKAAEDMACAAEAYFDGER